MSGREVIFAGFLDEQILTKKMHLFPAGGFWPPGAGIPASTAVLHARSPASGQGLGERRWVEQRMANSALYCTEWQGMRHATSSKGERYIVNPCPSLRAEVFLVTYSDASCARKNLERLTDAQTSSSRFRKFLQGKSL
jgi:hypothetical protein